MEKREPMIVCKDVTLAYDNNVVAEHLDLSVGKGDYLCVFGENGAGKSTLIQVLLKLKKPSAGEVAWSEELSGNAIGYLPQQTAVQRDFPASVEEIVLSGTLSQRGWRPFYNRTEKARAKEAMEQLDIAHLAKKCYRELSGGQQQRVLLARALCATRSMLLLDEPVTGLDPKAQAEFYKMVAELNEKGITVIMVSHDVGAAAYATHVLHIGNKRQLFFGRKEDYLASDTGKSFLGAHHD